MFILNSLYILRLMRMLSCTPSKWTETGKLAWLKLIVCDITRPDFIVLAIAQHMSIVTSTNLQCIDTGKISTKESHHVVRKNGRIESSFWMTKREWNFYMIVCTLWNQGHKVLFQSIVTFTLLKNLWPSYCRREQPLHQWWKTAIYLKKNV